MQGGLGSFFLTAWASALEFTDERETSRRDRARGPTCEYLPKPSSYSTSAHAFQLLTPTHTALPVWPVSISCRLAAF